MKDWKEEHCSEQPPELQIIAPELYIQRKNIHEVEHEATEEMPAYIEWVCESREISFSEYHQYVADEAIEQNRADITYVAMMADIEL